jgi:hypothetical protein
VRDDFSTDGNLVGSTPDVGGVWAAQTVGAGSGAVTVSQGTLNVSSALAEDVYSNLTAVVSNGSVYAGMDINHATPSSLEGTAGVTALQAFAHFNSFTASGSASACNIRTTGHTSTGYKLRLGQSLTAEMAYGTTYRLVYSFDTVTDKCSLWVNPTSEASTRIMTANSVAADTTISAVAFRQTNQTPPWAISIRNLIVSTTFAEACPPPPPPSPSFRANLGALIGVNMTYITIRVSADSAPGSTIVQATMIVPDLPASQSVMSVLNGANNTAHLSASLGVNVSSVTDVQTTSFLVSAPSPPS